MRARNIKPGLWLNEDLAEISIPARYLFPGLWCAADKDGRLEYRPKKIKAEIYPYDDVCVISLIAELHGKKFISVYENEGFLYIQINNFVRHQNPHPKEKSCGYPEPINICEYDGKLKKFNYTARNVILPFPSSSLIPSSFITDEEKCDEEQPEKKTKNNTDHLRPEFIPVGLWDELISSRKKKKLQNTALALKTFCNSLLPAIEAGYTIEDCIGQYVASKWDRFNVEWMAKNHKAGEDKCSQCNYQAMNVCSKTPDLRKTCTAFKPRTD